MDEKMNLKERAEVVRAMEVLARSVNNENFFDSWLVCGVADGDINPRTTDEDLEYYCDDDSLSDLMTLFLKIMNRAWKDGGLYCDGVTSKDVKGE